MVEGIDSFKEKFRGFEDCYTVIGGAACDILMAEADIDMILTLEDKKEAGELQCALGIVK